MSLRRTISWSIAMRDHARDRAASSPVNAMFAASMQRARALDARRVVQARALVVNGAFDLSAIMSTAVAGAKAARARGAAGSWQSLVGSALRFTWARAKTGRAGRQ